MNAPQTTQLPCDCVVPSQTGRLVSCPDGHDPDMPDHLRTRKGQS